MGIQLSLLVCVPITQNKLYYTKTHKWVQFPQTVIITYSLIISILSSALTFRRDKSILYSRNTLGSLWHSTQLGNLTHFSYFLTTNISLFGGLFQITQVTHFFHIFVLFISGVITQLTAFHPRKLLIGSFSNLISILVLKYTYNNCNIISKVGQQFKIIEYPLILLFIIVGGLFLMSSDDIVSVFLSIELQSYGLYLLATLYKNSELSTAAGLMYFLLGSLSSCLILLGTSLLYTNSGTTSLDGYYIIIVISNITQEVKSAFLDIYKPFYLNICLLIMSVGFLFKVSAAPFHFWSPDVYDGIPTIVTTFVAIITKISILILLLELVHHTSNLLYSNDFSWTYSLLLSSFLSFIIGTVLGLTQSRMKRLLAYSTISHLGFILLAITINSVESIQAFVFYIIQYSMSNLNVFFILIAIGYSLYPFVKEGPLLRYEALVERNNTPLQLISELKGYFYLNPLLAVSLGITLFSLVGIPPLVGFFAKQMVLSAALDDGYIFIAVLAILTSVISAAYYLNVIKQVFFDENELKVNESLNIMVYDCQVASYISNTNYNVNRITFGMESITLSVYITITISILTLIILLYMFMTKEWLSMTRLLSLLMFNI